MPLLLTFKKYKAPMQAQCVPAISLEPAVVKWIIDSSGMAHDNLAKKLKVDAATVGSWIMTGRMEYGKMREMAKSEVENVG